jgi:hypothetical protein
MFNGIWLVASEPLELQGREIQTGERFQISRIHSGALLAQGRATVAPKRPPEPLPDPPTPRRRRPRKLTTSTITPETPEAPEPSRTYQRRDLEPEP